jgi:hypothetical protein
MYFKNNVLNGKIPLDLANNFYVVFQNQMLKAIFLDICVIKSLAQIACSGTLLYSTFLYFTLLQSKMILLGI